jgi:hypothetical protein
MIIPSRFSSQLEAGAVGVGVGVAITGSLKTASDATRCVSWSRSFYSNFYLLILSVDGARARARARHVLVLVLLPGHDVAQVRPAAVVRAVRGPVAVLRAAVRATAIASRRKHSRALLAGR